MEKNQRVPKGEKYWYIDTTLTVYTDFNYTDYDEERMDIGNCFATKEEAESMARKLRAVLKGADVVEMPSNKIIVEEALRRYTKTNDLYCAFKNGADWLKSKIVK